MHLGGLMFEFEWLFLGLLFVLPWLVFGRDKNTQTASSVSLELPFFDQLDKGGILSNNISKFNFDKSLLWLAWLGLVLAAMKPIWIDEGIKLPLKGRDVMLSIDLSGSMREQDFTLNGARVDRLTVVKAAARQFIKARKKDRLGLIVFGDKAYLYAPLTFDKSLILQYLDDSVIGLAGQKTAMYDSIVLAIEHFRDNKKGDDEVRTLVVLTDGENTAGQISKEKAISLAKEEHIKIYTIGLGGDGRGGFFRRAGVDEATLKLIASETGGGYYRARDTKSLNNIYGEINKLEQQKVEDKFYRPKKDLFYYPLILFLFSLFLILLRKCR